MKEKEVHYMRRKSGKKTEYYCKIFGRNIASFRDETHFIFNIYTKCRMRNAGC